MEDNFSFNYLNLCSVWSFGTAKTSFKPQKCKQDLRRIGITFFPFLYQQTPLHIATKEGHELTVKSLVGKGATTNIQDKDGVSMKTLLSADLSLIS